MTAPALNLAERIEAEHEAAIGAARTAIEHAVACGTLLIEAKTQIGHGNWLAWVDANLSFGHRQAQKYTRLAEFSAKVLNANSNAHLTIDGALAAIAEPAQKPVRQKPKSTDEKPKEAPAKSPSLIASIRDFNTSWSPASIEAATVLITQEQRADLQHHLLPDVLQKLQRLAEPVADAKEDFIQPPPGRPRLDLDRLEEIKRAYDLLSGVDRNAFAQFVLKHQLQQTDLAPKQKAGLAKVLEVLTTYSGDAP